MQCHNCGKELADGAKFCKYCGSRLVEKEEAPEITEKQGVLEITEKQDIPEITGKQKASEEGVDKEASETAKQEAPGAVEDVQGAPSNERNAASEKRKTSPIVLISAAVSLVVLLFLAVFFK